MTATRLWMPPEWAPHRRTWMAWPESEMALSGTDGGEGAYRAWASVANAVVGFEPVVMVAPPGRGGTARRYLDPAIEIVERKLCDAWMRDFGPTFVLDGARRLHAVLWTFNGWGGRTFPAFRADALVGRDVAQFAGAEIVASKLVNEGGAIHVDGEGTVLLTESVQLNPSRNPNWTKDEVEAEIHRLLGTERAIWLPRGLAADLGEFGTDGHIDTLACFARPGLVLAHREPDPVHPDYEACRENIAILKAARDARGRNLEVVPLDAPAPRFHAAGAPLPLTYVNFFFVNAGIVACAFDDPRDEETAQRLARLFHDRRVVQVPASRIFEGGGGIHCITQQEPASGR